MSRLRKNIIIKESGFTIIELMIATLVFSVILLIITSGVLSFTKSYYRGVNSANLQDTVRSVNDAIIQDVQFSGGVITPTVVPPGSPGYFCAGGKIYAYTPGFKYDGITPSALTNAGLYEEDQVGACAAPTFSPGANGKELLSTNMRVSKLTLAPVTAPNGATLYNLTIRVVFGDDALLCSRSASPTSCSSNTNLTLAQLRNSDLQCKTLQGSQFCAVSELTSTIEERL